MTVSLRWIGGATMELRFGAFRVLTDPVPADGPIAFYMDGHPSTGEDGAPTSRPPCCSAGRSTSSSRTSAPSAATARGAS
jgi:hypothetical protein